MPKAVVCLKDQNSNKCRQHTQEGYKPTFQITLSLNANLQSTSIKVCVQAQTLPVGVPCRLIHRFSGQVMYNEQCEEESERQWQQLAFRRSTLRRRGDPPSTLRAALASASARAASLAALAVAV